MKDTHTWFSHHREVLRWDEIRHVTLVTKGMGLTAFLEKDVVGWKLLFERNDMAALDGLFKKGRGNERSVKRRAAASIPRPFVFLVTFSALQA